MGIVLLLIPLALGPCRRARLLVRSSDLHHTHDQPIPRLGGAVLALAFIGIEVFVALVAPEQRSNTPNRWAIIAGSLAMFGLGFWDDLRPLGAKKKLVGQIVIAAAVCYCGITIQVFKVPFTGHTIELGGLSMLVTVLWLVGMTNLINLIDGVDGLAGGICLMLMLLIAFVGQQGGNFGMLSCGMAGALLGFLWFNFPPAKIYLGDGGAYFLGFQIGLFSLVNSHKGTIFGALVAPLFVLALPLVDTSLAILRRGLRGLPVFRPDRRHLHHHLLDMGLSRRRVVLSFYAVTLVFLGMGLLTVWSRGQRTPLLFGSAVVLLLALAGRLKFSRDWFSVGRVLGNSLAMRSQVQYTVCLMRWLELEGARSRSVEHLWSDLVFAGQKLGFASIKLTLADGVRSWQAATLPENIHSATFAFNQGRLGVLELSALSVPPNSPAEAAQSDALSGPCVWEKRTFEIIGELLAEGWTKAATHWATEEKGALRFDARLVAPRRAFRLGWLTRVQPGRSWLL